jgi:predicted O-methyltransferase YrrM
MASDFEAVETYIESLFVPPDPVLEAALADAVQAGLPGIEVSPSLGKFLYLLAKLTGAAHILEIGTLGGYSAIWMARALPPGGKLVSLEIKPRHAEVARGNLARANLADRVEVIVGPALESLAGLGARAEPPFDMVFIDADKESYSAYLDAALRLVRPGALIIADNVVRRGGIADADSTDTAVRGVRTYLERLAADPRLDGTAVQTVGARGWDGFSVAIRR